MKRRAIALLISLLFTTAGIAASRQLVHGVAGVPWSGSREDFRRAIPSLTCAPIACRGPWTLHAFHGELELTWGGFSPVITSSTFKFSRSALSDMKAALRQELGAPKRQYREDGEPVTEWKIDGTLIDLYHGSATEKPQFYIEPKRKK